MESPLIAAIVRAGIAVIEGALARSCMIPVPRRSVVVRAARNASGAIASMPQASADHAKSTPSFSASTANSTVRSQSRRWPEAAPPIPIPVRISRLPSPRRQ